MVSTNTTGFLANYLIGGVACCVGEICTLPVDMIKVRFQCQGNHNTSLRRVVYQIYHQGGIQSFWSGGCSALLRIFMYCGLRLGFYEAGKDLLGPGNHLPFYKKAIAACCAGAFSAALCTPTDVIKTRLQAQDLLQKKYTGLVQTTKQIFQSEGMKGLYSAWLPTANRAAVIAVTEMATYDEIKNTIVGRGFHDGPATHLTASLCSVS